VSNARRSARRSSTPYVAGTIAIRSCPSASGTPAIAGTAVTDVIPGITSTSIPGQRRGASRCRYTNVLKSEGSP
jgi:hypothetical protein